MATQIHFSERTTTEYEITHNLNKILPNDLQNVKTIVKLLGVHKRNVRQVSGELHAFMIKLNSIVKQNGGEKRL